LKIGVCVKQVPAKDAPLTIAEGGAWIRETDIGFETNEPDTYALEEALRLKEKHNGEVVAISMGPERVKQTIKEALAKGADRGIHISDDEFFKLDPLGSARSLAAAIQRKKIRSDPHRPAKRRPGLRPNGRLARRNCSAAPRHHHHGHRSHRGRPETQARTRSRLVPVGRVLRSSRRAHDPIRHQQARYATLKGIMAAKKKEIARHRPQIARRADEPTQHIERIYVPQKPRKPNSSPASPKKPPPKAEVEARVLNTRRASQLSFCLQQSGTNENPGHHRTARRQMEQRQLRNARRRPANRQQTSGTLAAIVIGKGVSPLADELAAISSTKCCSPSTTCSKSTRPTASRSPCARQSKPPSPTWFCFPHTYQVRDFAPKLAASLGKGMIGDCIGYRYENGKLIFVRQMFQGRTAADVVFTGDPLDRLLPGRRIPRRSRARSAPAPKLRSK
jgi:electron transfer flavoprotein beta subunit